MLVQKCGRAFAISVIQMYIKLSSPTGWLPLVYMAKRQSEGDSWSLGERILMFLKSI